VTSLNFRLKECMHTFHQSMQQMDCRVVTMETDHATPQPMKVRERVCVCGGGWGGGEEVGDEDLKSDVKSTAPGLNWVTSKVIVHKVCVFTKRKPMNTCCGHREVFQLVGCYERQTGQDM